MTGYNNLLEEHFKLAVERLRRGAREDKGVYLPSCECTVLIIKLKNSVDISPVILALSELINNTLEAWRENE